MTHDTRVAHQKGGLKEVANANPAKAANPEQQERGTLAKLATLALAEFPKAEPVAHGRPANADPFELRERERKAEAKERGYFEARQRKVDSMLANKPAIRYALISDTEAQGDDVILTLSIRDLGCCELAIPRAKYDAFKVLRVIEEHSLGGG